MENEPRTHDERRQPDVAVVVAPFTPAIFFAFLFVGYCEGIACILSHPARLAHPRTAALVGIFSTGISLIAASVIAAAIRVALYTAGASVEKAHLRANSWVRDSGARRAILLAAPFVPAYLFLARGLFHGEGIRDMVGDICAAHGMPLSPWPFIFGGVTLACAAATWLFLWALIALRAGGEKAGREHLAHLPAAGLLAFAAVTVWINCTVALRLYEEVHGSLSAVALIASFLAALLVLSSRGGSMRRPPGGKRLRAATAVLGAGAVVFLFFRFHASQNVGQLMAERNPLQMYTVTRTQRALRATGAARFATLLPLTVSPPAQRPVLPPVRPTPQTLHRLLSRRTRWNVLVILVDSLRDDRILARRDGHPRFPAIHDIASRGVYFTRCYAQGPFTGISLPSIFSAAPVPFMLDKDPSTEFAPLVQILRDRGYRTCALSAFGKARTDARVSAYDALVPILQSFDRTVFEKDPAQQDAVLDRWLAEAAGRSGGWWSRLFSAIGDFSRLWRRNPYFIYWHMHGPRVPFRLSIFSDRETAAVAYDAQLSAEDARIGAVLKRIRTLGLDDNLIVVLLADHGEEILDHGAFFHGTSVYDEEIHVPLAFLVPGIPPRSVADPAGLIDVMPTLLDLLNIPTGYLMYGRSLVPSFDGELLPETQIFSFDASVYWTVIEGDWKLIWSRGLGFVELYNLREDPRERRNLADREPTRVLRMQRMLEGLVDSGLIKGGLGVTELRERRYPAPGERL